MVSCFIIAPKVDIVVVRSVARYPIKVTQEIVALPRRQLQDVLRMLGLRCAAHLPQTRCEYLGFSFIIAIHHVVA